MPLTACKRPATSLSAPEPTPGNPGQPVRELVDKLGNRARLAVFANEGH
jgi:hypothetical protein